MMAAGSAPGLAEAKGPISTSSRGTVWNMGRLIGTEDAVTVGIRVIPVREDGSALCSRKAYDRDMNLRRGANANGREGQR